MNDVLGLDADLATALTLIVTVALIPAITALLTHPRTPSAVKRALPIAIAVVAAALVMFLRGDFGTVPEWVVRWIMLAAALTGGAQTLYALLPDAWKGLSASTSRGKYADRDGVIDGRDTPRGER